MNVKQKLSVLEELYHKNKYREITDYWNNNQEDLDFTSNETSSQIAEILSVSYIELGEHKKALFYVNASMKFLLKEISSGKSIDDDFLDDIITFYDLKIEIFFRTNKVIHEYAYTNKYLIYGADKEVLRRKDELEDIIYDRYAFVNKVLMFASIGIFNLFLFKIGFFSHKYFLILSLVFGLWVILNSIFPERFRILFFAILKNTTSKLFKL